MTPIKLFSLLLIFLIFILSCGKKPVSETEKSIAYEKIYTFDSSIDTKDNSAYLIDTKGYNDNGKIYTNFDCPDSRFFPPIDIRYWDKTPVVNGRLPTYEETLNGMSIHHYSKNPYVKNYGMTLPKLASIYKPSTGKNEIVLVIQIAQTAIDTIVGYRYLTGGCGGSAFRDFHFLTDDEVKNIVDQHD